MWTKLQIRICISTLMLLNIGWGQLNIPPARSYTQKIYSIFLSDTNQQAISTHLSIKPLHASKTQKSVIFKDEGKYYYWITQKLFKEHFLLFKGDNFWCAVDPIVDLETGYDFRSENTPIKFWNTRGVRVQTTFFENFGFETSIYETQATLLDYQADYVMAHGEFLVSNNQYKQANGIVPGYARTKAFGSEGFDFAFAEGYFNYRPAEWFFIEAGNGNQFIGHGYRSLLLSDFTTNYPYIKPEILLFNKKLQYSSIFASQQNLYRLPFHTTPEANYERKLSVSHYLEYSFNKHFQIGVFENNMWIRTDSLGTKPFNILALNPLIGNSLLAKKQESNGFLGVNTSINIDHILVYGQLVFDKKRIGGLQIGMRAHDLFLPQLNFQLEYNQVENDTYIHQNKRLNFNHSNLPLAHPFGNNFQEAVFISDYQYKRFFVVNSTIYSKRFISSASNLNETILFSLNTLNTPKQANNVWFNRTELGYRFNKKYNLELYFGYLNRISTTANTQNGSIFAYFGLKTNLHQKTLDW